jgi:hypothetical protein
MIVLQSIFINNHKIIIYNNIYMANIQKINLIKPICYLHETEKYFPMKLNDYLDNCYVKIKIDKYIFNH